MKRIINGIVAGGILIFMEAAVTLYGGVLVQHNGAVNPTTESPPWSFWMSGGTVTPGTDTVNSVKYPYWEIDTPGGYHCWYYYQGTALDFSTNWVLQAILRIPTPSISVHNTFVAVFEGTRWIQVGFRAGGLYYYGPGGDLLIYGFTPDPEKYYTLGLVRDRVGGTVRVFLYDVLRGTLNFNILLNSNYYTNLIAFGDWTALGGASVSRWNKVIFYPKGIPHGGMVFCVR